MDGSTGKACKLLQDGVLRIQRPGFSRQDSAARMQPSGFSGQNSAVRIQQSGLGLKPSIARLSLIYWVVKCTCPCSRRLPFHPGATQAMSMLCLARLQG